jgi:hypothetical protein
MRGFKAFSSADRFCRAFDELPASGYLHQPDGFAGAPVRDPRVAALRDLISAA